MEFEPNYLFEVGDTVRAIAVDGEKPDTCFNHGIFKKGFEYIGVIASCNIAMLGPKHNTYGVVFNPGVPYRMEKRKMLSFKRNELLLVKKAQEDLPIPGMDAYIKAPKVKKPNPEEDWI